MRTFHSSRVCIVTMVASLCSGSVIADLWVEEEVPTFDIIIWSDITSVNKPHWKWQDCESNPCIFDNASNPAVALWLHLHTTFERHPHPVYMALPAPLWHSCHVLSRLHTTFLFITCKEWPIWLSTVADLTGVHGHKSQCAMILSVFNPCHTCGKYYHYSTFWKTSFIDSNWFGSVKFSL